MAESNCHVQYASCMFIGVPLTDACRIEVGALSVVSAGMVEFTHEIEREDATDYSATNFGGNRCGPELKGTRKVKWGNESGSMCLIDWGFQAMTSGNPVVLDADGNTIGYQELASQTDVACASLSSPKVAVAIVRKAAQGDGGCSSLVEGSGATGFTLHVFGNTTDWGWDDSGFKNERTVRSFTSTGYANPNIGAGPFNLWPATATPDTIDPASIHSEVFVSSDDLPAAVCGTVAHPAVSDRTPSSP